MHNHQKATPPTSYLCYGSHLCSVHFSASLWLFGLPSMGSSIPNFGKGFGVLYQPKQTHTLNLSIGSIPSPRSPAWLASLLELLTGTQGAWPAARGSTNSSGFGLQQQLCTICGSFPPSPSLHPTSSPGPHCTLKRCKAVFQGSEPGCPRFF